MKPAACEAERPAPAAARGNGKAPADEPLTVTVPRLLSPGHVARALACSRQNVLRLIEKGALLAYDVAEPDSRVRRWAVPAAEVAAFLVARGVAESSTTAKSASLQVAAAPAVSAESTP